MSTAQASKILLVSHLDVWVRAMRTMLASTPDIVVIEGARGGLGAYQIVVSESPDAVLIDDSVPYDEIIRLLTLLRDLTARPYCAVIAGSSRLNRQFITAGADAVLSREATSEQLSAILHSDALVSRERESSA